MASRIESINKVQVYEENGEEIKQPRSERPSVIISEHWNRSEFVVINMGELFYTVCAKDLERAIQNAQNAHIG